MRKKFVQISLLDTYQSVEDRLAHNKPELFRLLDEHLDWDALIPDTFYTAFYQRFGRKRRYELESFLRALFLQRIFHYVEDSQLLNTLRFSYEMRDYCGFDKVPDASKLTRFKQNFCNHIRDVFEQLVDLTEPICRVMDAVLADLLIFDTTGIESYVAENNPKFPYTKVGKLVEYTGVAVSNPAVKHQYINGHMCYAQRAGVLTNGLGIVRHLELFDEEFRAKHPEIPREPRKKSPEIEKEIYDSVALKPVLQDFRAVHPTFRYATFAGDAAFDSYDNYSFLLKEYRFQKAVIPMNPRGSDKAHDSAFSENGTPLCPADGTPLLFHSKSGGKNRSARLKFVCPKSKLVQTERGATRRCQCENPCVDSKYGRCVYVYPDKNLRLYPGLSRDSDEFSKIYNRRAAVERSINTLKDTLGLAGRKTSNVRTTKADLFLAGIVQLLCVLLAHKLHDLKLARRPRRLIA
jgi:hypothetical protein